MTTHPLYIKPAISKKIADDYVKGVLLVKQIAEKYGVSVRTVCNHARRHNPRVRRVRGGSHD